MNKNKSKKGTRALQRRTPKGRNVTHYVKETPKQATCARCSGQLQGIPRLLPNLLKKLTRSQRSVSRKFGGVLCGNCVKETEKYKIRMESGYIVRRDLTIEKYLPAGWFKSLGIEAAKSEVKEAKVKAETSEEALVETPKKAPAKKAVKKPAAKKTTAKKTTKKAAPKKVKKK